ncbi:MAG: class I SAM-dependent methyltransferase [Planctomycetota bacterium]
MPPSTDDATTRFTDRVDAYVKYRPGYPTELLTGLAELVGLRPTDTLADLGAGTGLSSKLFLDHGNAVIGVEPNTAMRAAGARFLAGAARFRMVDGTAEATGLAAHSVDGVVAGQAFHWFAPDRARTEALRILRPGGFAALIWNSRPLAGTPFLQAYEAFCTQFGTDYTAVNHTTTVTPERLDSFFGAGRWVKRVYPNAQIFDFDGLHGRVLSSSYLPDPTQASYPAMLAALRELFAAQAQDGRVRFAYDTELYAGKLAAD